MKRKNATRVDGRPAHERPAIRELSSKDLDKLRGGTEPLGFHVRGSWGSYRKYRQ